LFKAGYSKTEAVRLAGVWHGWFKRLAGAIPVVHVNDAAKREKRRTAQPSIVEQFQKFSLEPTVHIHWKTRRRSERY
jgi:hypothetical protein